MWLTTQESMRGNSSFNESVPWSFLGYKAENIINYLKTISKYINVMSMLVKKIHSHYRLLTQNGSITFSVK